MKRIVCVKANNRRQTPVGTGRSSEGLTARCKITLTDRGGWTPRRNRVPRIAFSVPASSVRDLSRLWTDRLAPYRRHRNDEHLEALVEEAIRYTGLHLENDLGSSPYWGRSPLSRRVAVLLFLVDRGVVERQTLKGKRLYAPRADAEAWVAAQPALSPYVEPALELIASLRREHSRRSAPNRAQD